MEVKINEERIDPVIELHRTTNIILTREEYDQLQTVFCKGKGWSQDYPHTVNVRSITLTGNYKWMPATSVEFRIEIDKEGKDQRIEASNNDIKINIERENSKAQ
jgi:hypothetical protein